MLRTLMTSKIHRATVTQADLHYVGSVTIDPDLTEAAGLVENEQVTIADITNGQRVITYVIEGERGSGVIGINGAAAHLVSPGDLVIIMAYGQLDETEVSTHHPRVVHVDESNRIVAIGDDGAEPVPGMTDQICGRESHGMR
jgi:aspartate 1-decarboxylase